MLATRDYKRGAKTISKVDAICDFLEVYIHGILYARGIYPQSLFEDQYAYGIPVKASRHPELNGYIINVVAAIKSELEKEGPLGDVMVNIVDDEDNTIEAFVLELSTVCGIYERAHDIELRAAIIRMSTLDPPPDTPQDKSFQVLYRPRDGSAPSQQSKWLPRIEGKKDKDVQGARDPATKLVPLASVESAELKVQAFALLRRG
ncbi:DNA-binding protein [Coemansia reversa NRRL 1564]|uniref:DNA-binding protein n=1 Tax=Coemansia reversa (strain ATCC 12441 / NRRL 1564) TaxID=763665 RepID=A0A2G5BK24_COERN|nr:DNA-binding protein [Coemansia reversa NRRL 1564]|eukprot:PIA19360.1 DNA-binding protein [Coemansia reversa NRRL 1564]